MNRPKKKLYQRRKKDPQARCRLLTDEGNNQMKLGNEQKAVFMYSKVSFIDIMSTYKYKGTESKVAQNKQKQGARSLQYVNTSTLQTSVSNQCIL